MKLFCFSKRDNYRCMGSFMSSNLFFQGMMYLVTLVYGGYLIANGEMQTADLAMYALYIGIFYQSDPDSGRAGRNDAKGSFRHSAVSLMLWKQSQRSQTLRMPENLLM